MNSPIPLRGLLLLALFAAALSAPRPASAQLTRADTAAVLLAAAEDFANRGADDVAEALYRHILERFPGTVAAETARTRLEVVTGRQSQAGGEVELKVWSALYGLWQGVALPLAFNADDAEVYGLGLLVGGPAGFLIGRAMARSRPRSLGQARAITWGGTWGAIQGLGWAHALNFGGDEYDPSDEAVMWSMIAGGAVGIVGGAVAARREVTSGTSTSATLGSLWGLWIGAATAVLVDPDMEGDAIVATVMLTGNAGLGAGALLGSRVPLSRSRARLISLAGVIGGFASMGINMIAQPDDPRPRVVMGTMLAASLGGLALGASLTSGGRGEDDPSEDLEAAASLPAPGALLNWSDGDWALSTPLPSPVLEPTGRRDGRDGLVWKVPLLKVRF